MVPQLLRNLANIRTCLASRLCSLLPGGQKWIWRASPSSLPKNLTKREVLHSRKKNSHKVHKVTRLISSCLTLLKEIRGDDVNLGLSMTSASERRKRKEWIRARVCLHFSLFLNSYSCQVGSLWYLVYTHEHSVCHWVHMAISCHTKHISYFLQSSTSTRQLAGEMEEVGLGITLIFSESPWKKTKRGPE